MLLLPKGSTKVDHGSDGSASIFIECPEVTSPTSLSDLPDYAYPHATITFVIINQHNKHQSMVFKPVEHRFTPERPNFGKCMFFAVVVHLCLLLHGSNLVGLIRVSASQRTEVVVHQQSVKYVCGVAFRRVVVTDLAPRLASD